MTNGVSSNYLRRGTQSFNGGAEENMREERRRYTAQLQRRAQAHVTAELGGGLAMPDIDRQVIMIIQHAQQSTKAKRVSLYRPVVRGHRWHVATILSDGAFAYTSAALETLNWPKRTVGSKQRQVLDRHHPQDGRALTELSLRSYVGVPIMAEGTVVGVIEAVDVLPIEELPNVASMLEELVAPFGPRLIEQESAGAAASTGSNPLGLQADTMLDLVLRQPYEQDDTFEVSPSEFEVLNYLNGDRTLAEVAVMAALPLDKATAIAGQLVERGLARIGRENRRRL